MIQQKTKGFTIVELLCVIAIGAVLMAIIIPVASGARRQYAISETKARFQRYTLAMEQFKAEYGSYPFTTSPVNINTTPGQFLQIMTGHNLTGGAMDDPVAQSLNPKALSFLQLSSNEVTNDGLIQDSFGQTNIALYIDTDSDGFLNNLPNGQSVRGSLGWQSTGSQINLTSW